MVTGQAVPCPAAVRRRAAVFCVFCRGPSLGVGRKLRSVQGGLWSTSQLFCSTGRAQIPAESSGEPMATAIEDLSSPRPSSRRSLLEIPTPEQQSGEHTA